MRIVTTFIFTILVGAYSAHGQNDSSKTEKFYLRLQKISQKSKLGYFLYETIFNLPDSKSLDSLVNSSHHEQGLHIRNIIIKTRDPFGSAMNDTTNAARSVLQIVGNTLHTRTKQKAIGNQLMFQAGEKVDSLKITESERIIRNCGYIRDVAILVLPVSNDSADVIVETVDQWSFSTSATITSTSTRWRFTGFDLFGLGHRFGNTLDWKRDGFKLLKPEIEGYYRIPDIAGSFTSLEVTYLDKIQSNSLGITVDRPFYSSLTNWAGGASASRNYQSDSIRITKDYKTGFSREWNQYSAWIGKSIPVRGGRSKEERSTRFVIGSSFYLQENHSLNTTDESASTALSSGRTLLGSVGFSNRSYSVNRYIFQSGDEEDVPSGRKVQLTSGVESKSNVERFYFASSVGLGGYLKGGFYYSSSLDWSSFLKKDRLQDSKIQFKSFLFTPLIGGEDWKFRIFSMIDYTRYQNQTNYRPVGLNEDVLLPGYELDAPEGIERLAGNVTFALFNPIEIIGFKITPLLYLSAGFIGDGEDDIWQSSYQSALGAGVVITNEYLSQSDFKLVVSFFPNQPDFWKVGGVSAWEYGFADFDFQKPDVVY